LNPTCERSLYPKIYVGLYATYSDFSYLVRVRKSDLRSILSTFYVRVFCMKARFWSQNFVRKRFAQLCNFWRQNIGKKSALKCWWNWLDFINIPRKAFNRTDPKSVKIQLSCQYLFALLGSLCVKAARKT